MRVVAVIPAWNARSRLDDVLDALDGQVEHVVVVDNLSSDGTAAWLSTARANVACLESGDNIGYAAAVNRAIEHARRWSPDAVLLVNDDAVFGPGAVALLSAALERDATIGAASAHMVYADDEGTLNGAGGTFDRERGWAALRGAGTPDDGRFTGSPDVEYPSGAASLLRSAALDDVGGMDEAYYLYFEDADWGLRAAELGWRTIYVPEARVVHVGSAGTADDPARRRYYNVRNRLRLARRHASRSGRALAWAETIGLLAKQPPRWISPARRRDAEAVFLGVLDHLRGRYGRSARFG
ncbi:MAG: glycosyltransferase family 2 protein [Anaerolineae bacterium]